MENLKKLENLIKEAQNHYYNGTPIMSDLRYDSLMEELRVYNPNHQLLNNIGAPPIKNTWKKVFHEIGMKSLNKVNSYEEFLVWAKGTKKTEFLGTEKLDGISVSLKYENGVLKLGATRGNGEKGDDITSNVIRMSGVPHQIDKNFSGHIRGEIVLLKSVFKQHFEDMANTRNAASGIARRTDGEGADKLNVICYKIEGEDFKTELDSFKRIDELGFVTPNYKVLDTNGTIQMWNEYKESIRDSLDYDIDGLVFTVNDCAAQYAMGDKGRGPAGAIAFKFDPPGAETIIKDIVWQVGPTGRMTPVAVFEKVSILGTNVSKASLYNYSYIKELGIGVGAKVLVIRANDVIPRVEELIEYKGEIAEVPTKCPECGGKVEQVGEYTICTNKLGCPPQQLGLVSTWIKELGVLEWGDKVIKKMLDAGIVRDVPDIYTLTAEDICKLDKMGKRSAEVLLQELDKYREIPLYNLIGGLGIENVATSTTKKIMKSGHDTLEKMFSLTPDDVENIPGFAYTKASAFCDGLKENKERIQRILDSGVKIKEQAKGSLSGKSFCFTQSCPDYGRKELCKIVEDAGGEVEKSVKKGVSFLVLADESKATAKVTAAKKNSTNIITYDEFLEMAGV